MQIAYLILAHNNYKHLERLINALSTPDCRFYIHIDKKSKMPEMSGPNLFFIKERVKVTWSSFSEVEATINLLRAAIKDENDYFVFLSGVDYPVRSNEEIKKRLEEGFEFVHIHEQSKQSSHPISYFKYYYFSKFYGKSKGFKYIFFKKIEKTLRRLRIRKAIPFKIYAGGQWFALTRDCAEYILKEIKDKQYIQFFRYSRFPSESFFLTIIGNSCFIDRTGHYLTYTDWRNHTPPIISEKHIPILRGSPYLFARKFDDESTGIIALIDKELRKASKIVKI